ncbi:MAG: MFS transporter [Thermodesulfobacteriota bacterium]
MPPASPHDENPSFYTLSRLGPILFIALLFFVTFIARVILSPLMPAIEAELELSHAQAGRMFFILSLGYFIALAGSGFLSARITHKSTIICSVGIVGLALLAIAASRGGIGLRAAVFFLGMAAGLYLPSGITTLTDMVEAKNWGKAVSIHELAPNLGFVAAPLLAELLLIWFSWRIVPAVLGIAAIGIALLFARVGRWGRFSGQPPGIASIRRVFSEPFFWIMVILFSVGISSTMGLYTMLPLYLINDIGISRPQANTLIACSRVAGMASALFSGWATDRFGARKTIICALALTGTATLLLGAAASPLPAVLLVFLQAVLATIYFPAGFTALSTLFPAEIRNVAISLTIPFAFLFGAGLVPSMIGYLGDIGSFSMGIAATGGLILAGSLLALALKFHPSAESSD